MGELKSVPACAATDRAELQVDRAVNQLVPILAALELLTDFERVMTAISEFASLQADSGRSELEDLLQQACPTWRNPHAHGGDTSSPAIISELARVAHDTARRIFEVDAQ